MSQQMAMAYHAKNVATLDGGEYGRRQAAKALYVALGRRQV